MPTLDPSHPDWWPTDSDWEEFWFGTWIINAVPASATNLRRMLCDTQLVVDHLESIREQLAENELALCNAPSDSPFVEDMRSEVKGAKRLLSFAAEFTRQRRLAAENGSVRAFDWSVEILGDLFGDVGPQT